MRSPPHPCLERGYIAVGFGPYSASGDAQTRPPAPTAEIICSCVMCVCVLFGFVRAAQDTENTPPPKGVLPHIGSGGVPLCSGHGSPRSGSGIADTSEHGQGLSMHRRALVQEARSSLCRTCRRQARCSPAGSGKHIGVGIHFVLHCGALRVTQWEMGFCNMFVCRVGSAPIFD